MKKIKAIVYSDNYRFIEAIAEGYEVTAFNNPMIVTKSVMGYWQVYDIDSRMPTVLKAESRREALEKLRRAEFDIPQNTYEICVLYWKDRQGRQNATEIEMNKINDMRLGIQ